jgi:hypothetical protein
MIKVERRRILGVFPATGITLSQPHVATRLANRVNGAVRGTQPLSRVDPHDAALVALVTTGGLRSCSARRNDAGPKLGPPSSPSPPDPSRPRCAT